MADLYWRERARCRGTDDPEAFFAEVGTEPYDEALAVCARCPVTTECLDDVMAAEHGWAPSQRHGVRAGLGPRERAELAGDLRVRRNHRQRADAGRRAAN